jgi:hypothetical protein
MRSATLQHSCHGILRLPQKPESVTYVSGMLCNLCAGKVKCLTRFVPDGMFNVSARKCKSRCGSVADGTYKTIVHFKLDN